MNVVSNVSHEWATRPAPERHLDLAELHAVSVKAREESDEHDGIKIIDLKARHVKEDSKVLTIEGKAGVPYSPSHFTFQRLCNIVGAQPEYLRRLPAKLTSDVLNWHMSQMGTKEVSLMTQESGSGKGLIRRLRAVTSGTYGRVWNSDITRQAGERFGWHNDGQWRVPSEFGKTKGFKVTRENTTIYGSPDDMFFFLCDEENRIEIPNRRDGKKGSLARGFWIGNSEVGAGVLFMAFGLFDYACQNRNLWGAEGFEEIRVKHFSGAPDRWLTELAPKLADFANRSAKIENEAIAAAVKAKLPGTLEEFGRKQPNRVLWTDKNVNRLLLTHQEEENRPIETLWDLSVALTAFAKSVPFQDERMMWEREGGRVLQLASK